MDQMPMPPTLSVTLPVEQWNIVLEALANAPYRVSAPLIQAIQQQAQNFAAAQAARREIGDRLAGDASLLPEAASVGADPNAPPMMNGSGVP